MFLTSLQQSFDLGASCHLTLRFLSERSRFIFFNSPFHFIFSSSLLICSKQFDSIFLTSVTLFSVKTFFNFSISSIITRERRLPCSHQQTFSFATFYRPPATTISFYSTSSSPEKENSSSNRLGPPPPPQAGGLRSQKGLRTFNPLQRINT